MKARIRFILRSTMNNVTNTTFGGERYGSGDITELEDTVHFSATIELLLLNNLRSSH